MSVSSDALLFYGFSAEDVGDWGEIDNDDWEALYAEKKGVSPQVYDGKNQISEEALREYWRKTRKLLLDEPCEIGYHCMDGSAISYVCIKSTLTTASRGTPREVKTLEIDPAWRDQLKKFCDLMEIPWQESKWYLASWMG